MTQIPSIPTDDSAQSTGKTGRLGQSDIEQSLTKALDSGPTAIPEQIRYLLALCQMSEVPATSQTNSYLTKPLSIAQARLSALESLMDTLGTEHRKSLIEEISKINDINIRILLLARLAIYIDPQDFRDTIREIWQQVEYIGDLVIRTQAIFQIAPLLSLLEDEPAASSVLLNILRIAEAIPGAEARLRSLAAIAPHLPYDMSIRTFQRILDELERSGNDSLRVKTLLSMSENVPAETMTQALNIAERITTPAERARTLTALAQSVPTDLRPRLRQDALDAISIIDNDEDRAEALIAFSPHLDYATEKDKFPVIVAKALKIAIAIARRHIRARVLVAIAPHLTTDLQGEALAAVHSLSSEQDRARLLAELAPNLPPNMLVASLAVAHTMVEQDARVHALSVLAHYVPESARQQTLLDALAAASNLPHYLERVTAIIDLADLLPPDLLEQALSNALESATNIENDNAKARALNLLGNHLPNSLLERALDIALEIETVNQRLNALMGIITNLTSEKKQRQARRSMLECAKQTHLEFKQARSLVMILPHLSQDMLVEVESLADAMIEPFDQVTVYLAVAQNSPPEKRPTLISKAWKRLQQIEDGYDRASMIASIAPFLPETTNGELAQAISDSIDIIQDGYDKASAISILTPLVTDGSNGTRVNLPDTAKALEKGIETAISIPNQILRGQYLTEGAQMWVNLHDKNRSYNLWRHIIWQFRSMPLADVLVCMASLMPILKEICDRETLQRIAEVLGIR